MLFQGYEELNGVDRAFKVYAESSDYQTIITSGKVGVRLRNLWKIEALQLRNPSSETPAYGVVTRFASADLMLERATMSWRASGSGCWRISPSAATEPLAP